MSARALSLDEPLNGSKLIITGLALAIGNFLVVLDTTIANVSIANIAGGLAISPTQGTWVITSYAVADAIVVPLTGWLALRYGPVRVMATAMMLFGLFSAICGLSHSLSMLVAARVFQGAVGAPMIPMSQSLLVRVFGPKRAGAATGIWASTTIVAPVLGPLLGGRICDNLGWEWIFYVNVPIALFCAILIYRLIGDRDDKGVRAPVDFVGLGLLITWVGALQIVLDKGQELDWFGSMFIVELTTLSAVAFAAFLIWELTDANPIVNLRVFRNRTFLLSVVIIALAYGAFFASNVLQPVWVQTTLGYTATESGNVASVTGISAFFVAPLVARMLSKIDVRILLSFGMLVTMEAMLWRAHFTPDLTSWQVALPNFFQGIGIPFFFLPATTLALSSFKGAEVANAAGMSSFVRTLSGAFGASFAASSWQDHITAAKAGMADSLKNADATINALVARGFTPEQARAQIDGLAQGQASTVAIDQMFYYFAAMLVVCVIVVWMIPKPKRPTGPVAAH